MVEFVLKLKCDYDFWCKCCDSEVFIFREVKWLVECLVNDILFLYLFVYFDNELLVKCIFLSKFNKVCVNDEDFFYINLNCLEMFVDIMCVIVCEWVCWFVIVEYNIIEDF